MVAHIELTDTRILSNTGDPNSAVTIQAEQGVQILFDFTNKVLYVGGSADNGTNDNWTVV